ncbi:MAG: hypothetical protein COV36_08185 [Alphaproteobacteria bacterium CG11_big_fil_rev_8_21_14_0_20_44_7]|nr:MAG: hypothetical protein COV36_08185 [Alphaproteobacteria bacterium CG11_big_fil_rev_8_21_14_0_20_44_7]
MKKGFTLVELGIVLVVIGLLTGAVIVAQNLTETAKLQSVIAQLLKYKDSAHQFKDKYGGWPGDMPNASSFWDVDASGSGTHDGNGDGDIRDAIASTPASDERVVFWQHLSKAGYLAQDYTGTWYVENGQFTHAGINVPAMSYGKGPHAKLRNFIQITWVTAYTAYSPNFLAMASGFVFTADDARYIDYKIDDGKPISGDVLVASTSSCATATSNPSDYDIYSTTEQCAVLFNAHLED